MNGDKELQQTYQFGFAQNQIQHNLNLNQQTPQSRLQHWATIHQRQQHQIQQVQHPIQIAQHMELQQRPEQAHRMLTQPQMYQMQQGLMQQVQHQVQGPPPPLSMSIVAQQQPQQLASCVGVEANFSNASLQHSQQAVEVEECVSMAQPSESEKSRESQFPQLTSMSDYCDKEMPSVLEDHGIRDVWASNMEEELQNISHVVKTHRYIAMDTEFPGVVARPIGEFRSTQEYTYHQMKCNVNLLKIIQIGFTFFDENGTRAKPISTWQFNFKFNLEDDMYAQESIELLRKSGIQFERHEKDGMDPFDFAAELIGAGVVLQPNVFLSFHSGYDFGYFIKMLQNRDLEEDDEEFFSKLRLHCPDIYDVKYLMKSCKDLKGGLQEVSDYLQIKRLGPQHQAGSDSLLTGLAFFKMRELYFENNIEREKYSGHLYGLGPSSSNASNATNGVPFVEHDTNADNGSQLAAS